MDEYKRHTRIFSLCRVILRPFVKGKFNYRGEEISGIEGPFLLLANHNTDFDPLFLGASSRQHMYFVATEKITRMGFWSRLIMYYFKPIIHYKGKMGISSVKEILLNLKEGRNVALFPEGNRSFNGVTGDFLASTGKMAKRSGATLVTYKFRGGYFSSPRWGSGTRRGKLSGEIAGIYPPEKLKEMSEAEINDAIRRDLYVDAYADQKKEKIAFKGRDRAVGIESTLFLCPGCGKISTLKGKRNSFSCACGYMADYDEYGYIHDKNGNIWTITELDSCQQLRISELLSEKPETLLFSDEVLVQHIDKDHSVAAESSELLQGFTDRLEIGSLVLPFDEITGMAVNRRNLLIIHYGEEDNHIELIGNISFSALKYLYLYKLAGNLNEKI